MRSVLGAERKDGGSPCFLDAPDLESAEPASLDLIPDPHRHSFGFRHTPPLNRYRQQRYLAVADRFYPASLRLIVDAVCLRACTAIP
jgi:hypothetical protein